MSYATATLVTLATLVTILVTLVKLVTLVTIVVVYKRKNHQIETSNTSDAHGNDCTDKSALCH